MSNESLVDRLKKARDLQDDFTMDAMGTLLNDAIEVVEGWALGLKTAETVPTEIRDMVLTLGPIEWTASKPETAFAHAQTLYDVIEMTMKDFDLGDLNAMNWLQTVATGKTISLVGMSPNSVTISRAFVGIWNAFHGAMADGGHLAASVGFDMPKEETPALTKPLVDAIMDNIRDVVTEAQVDEPAGRGAGYNIDYDEDGLRSIINDIILTGVAARPLRRNDPAPKIIGPDDDAAMAAAMTAFASSVRSQEPEWSDDVGEEGEILLTSPSGDYFALEYPIRDAIKAATKGKL